jgi:selenocysteine lyase/cysteine desulfurase
LDNVEARVGGLTGKLKAAVAEIPGASLRSPESPALSTGIVTFSVQGIDGTDLNGQMFERWKVLGRPALNHSAMRLSTAFFTSDEEIDTIISAISTIANENR